MIPLPSLPFLRFASFGVALLLQVKYPMLVFVEVFSVEIPWIEKRFTNLCWKEMSIFRTGNMQSPQKPLLTGRDLRAFLQHVP